MVRIDSKIIYKLSEVSEGSSNQESTVFTFTPLKVKWMFRLDRLGGTRYTLGWGGATPHTLY